MIPLLRPSWGDREIDAVAEVLKSGWGGQGPKCEEFERRLAEMYGRKHCVTVNSCTAALHLALLASGVGPGDEVVVPALTFASTALAVKYVGATPVWADVYADTLCVDYSDPVWWPDEPSERNCWAIGVDFAGHPANGGAYHSSIIQDAAHSAGGLSWGPMTCLSFHPVKNLATGDGGAILLDDDEKAERLRRLRWCGIDRSTWTRTGRRYAWDYEIRELGYKSHWSDIMAAIGLVQLDRLAEMNLRRREIAMRYMAELGDWCQLPADHIAHTWHLFVIRVDADERDRLIDSLAADGIAAGVHYRPLSEHPLWNAETPPVTAREWVRMVSLPIHADLSDEDQGRVIAAVKRGLSKMRRAA